jgi:hypothetical protein
MDLRPVEAVAAVRPVNVKRTIEDVAPTFAIDRPGRMEEDSYNSDTGQQNRGLEDEEDGLEDGMDELNDGEQPPESPPGHDPDPIQPVKHLDFFA